LDVDYYRISGSLGSLLLVWSRLEKAMREQITGAESALPAKLHGAGNVLRAWETMVSERHPNACLAPLLAKTVLRQLQEPLQARNGLCHGLIDIQAETEQGPATLRWELNGETHSISWDELQAQFGWISRLTHAILLISKPHVGRTDLLADTAENRGWWRSEFSLDLPE
jgi:hypothetical protein